MFYDIVCRNILSEMKTKGLSEKQLEALKAEMLIGFEKVYNDTYIEATEDTYGAAITIIKEDEEAEKPFTTTMATLYDLRDGC